MEPILLLFLLALGGNNHTDIKQSLQNALRFYRENRELITLLANGLSGNYANATAPTVAREDDGAQQKSRPDEVGNLSILEEFLRTHS